MAADGAWARVDAPPREAVRVLVAELEARLGRPDDAQGPPATHQDLMAVLEALRRRIAHVEDISAERAADLRVALACLASQLQSQSARAEALLARVASGEARTAGQLDALAAEVASAKAGPAAEPAPVRAVLWMASALAALSVAAAAVVVVRHPELLPQAVAAPLARLTGPPLRQDLRPEVARAFAAGVAASVAAGRPDAPVDDYAATAAALERGDPDALPRLTGLAEAGDLQAQMLLARLYERGGAGLARDLAASRLWTRRAAEGGDRIAMHNLALFLAEGEGGPRDAAEAARWFRRAAERGVVDSQHNLALLLEAGRGAPRNLREAYRWFAIAANAGDLESREKMVALEARLAASERAGLDRDAARFRPGEAAPDPGVIVPPAATVAETQALLARRGYYIGPTDGVASPALARAAAAYLRDHPGVAGETGRP